ncbi:MAG: DUF951 domain-containing protein [Dehalococcoidia bacterium]|nr:DUF951 domain-containing protein [Dehalococcoidia bacterium]
MNNKLAIGNVISLKKKHPCGGYTWTIYRRGADVGIKCLNCNHQLLINRLKLIKSIRA